MKKLWPVAAMAVALVAAVSTGSFTPSEASDHDDGDNDIKSRALNLTDHFAFKSPTAPDELSLIMYFNPRSLPGRQYTLSTTARYEFHVSKAASRTSAPTVKDDYIFRFEAKEAGADGVQDITLTVLKDGVSVGKVDGKSTSFAVSKSNTGLTINTGAAGGLDVKYFVGMRADSFAFDVNRFFQVRNFLANRFFGGTGGSGRPICTGTPPGPAGCVTLAANCEGDAFLQGILGVDPDADDVNLFNPPTCAPDFTKNLNVTAIVLNVKIAQLGGTVFDTWSTISRKP